MLTPRDLAPADLQHSLRAILGLPTAHPLPAEQAANLPHPLPPRVTLDVGPFIAWSLAGLRLFDGPRLPSLRTALLETRRIITALGMLHAAGNLTHAAKALDTSRKVLRDNLRYTDLYPWPGAFAHEPDRDTPAILPHPHGTDHSIGSRP